MARRQPDGSYVVGIAAADIGTGARTALTQIAADTLRTAPDRVRLEIGDSDLPYAMLAGGSMGTASWGSAIVKACRELRDGDADEVRADTTEDIENDEPLSRHAFGAQFVEARVNGVTGEVRVSRALGVFAVGRIINAKLARSQFIGGMTMGIGMALTEEGIHDPHFGDVVTRDLATYHVPTYADIVDLDATWIDEDDPHLNPMGSKGIGEIGIVGTAAAVANAVFHATGHRFRRVPIGISDVLTALARQLNWVVDGAIAQLGERLLCKQEVAGSIPAGSIIRSPGNQTFLTAPESLAHRSKSDWSSTLVIKSGAHGRSAHRRRPLRLGAGWCPSL